MRSLIADSALTGEGLRAFVAILERLTKAARPDVLSRVWGEMRLKRCVCFFLVLSAAITAAVSPFVLLFRVRVKGTFERG